MQETISLRFKYSEEEYVAATRLFVKRSTDFIFRLLAFIVYSIACIFLFIWLEFAAEAIALLVLVSCLPFAIGYLSLVVLPRQRFRGDPRFRDDYLLQFSDDGIQFQNSADRCPDSMEPILKGDRERKILPSDLRTEYALGDPQAGVRKRA